MSKKPYFITLIIILFSAFLFGGGCFVSNEGCKALQAEAKPAEAPELVGYPTPFPFDLFMPPQEGVVVTFKANGNQFSGLIDHVGNIMPNGLTWGQKNYEDESGVQSIIIFSEYFKNFSPGVMTFKLYFNEDTEQNLQFDIMIINTNPLQPVKPTPPPVIEEPVGSEPSNEPSENEEPTAGEVAGIVIITIFAAVTFAGLVAYIALRIKHKI